MAARSGRQASRPASHAVTAYEAWWSEEWRLYWRTRVFQLSECLQPISLGPLAASHSLLCGTTLAWWPPRAEGYM